MASSSSSTSDITHALLLVFKGEGYEHWSYRMKTFFRSQRLWRIVEGISKEKPDEKEADDDDKALFLLQ